MPNTSSMKRKWVTLAVVVAALFLFLVPLVPKAPPSHSNCVFCPLDLGIDYTSITYWLFGIGVYHTVWGTLVLNL